MEVQQPAAECFNHVHNGPRAVVGQLQPRQLRDSGLPLPKVTFCAAVTEFACHAKALLPCAHQPLRFTYSPMRVSNICSGAKFFARCIDEIDPRDYTMLTQCVHHTLLENGI
jgi:hypothetical protein